MGMFGACTCEDALDARNVVLSPFTVRLADDLVIPQNVTGYQERHSTTPYLGKESEEHGRGNKDDGFLVDYV